MVYKNKQRIEQQRAGPRMADKPRQTAKEEYIAKTPGEKEFHTYIRQMEAEWEIAKDVQGASPSLQERGKRIVKKWKKEALSGKNKNYSNQ